ncbi:hypothetical protein BB560_005927, partial [Smittium megazygosporum]
SLSRLGPKQLEKEPEAIDIFTMDILYFHALIDYISENKFPPGADDDFRKRLRNRAQKYKVVDNNLFKKSKGVLKEGHEGVENTWERAKKIYSAEGLYKLVENVVKECPDCQKFKSNKEKRAYLYPILATKPFSIMGIDAVGPFSP